METKLARIAEIAKNDSEMKFTSLAHLLNHQWLKTCHHELPGNKAAGINGTTKVAYGENLEKNVANLISRMKTKSYRPLPVRRTYIPKQEKGKKKTSRNSRTRR